MKNLDNRCYNCSELWFFSNLLLALYYEGSGLHTAGKIVLQIVVLRVKGNLFLEYIYFLKPYNYLHIIFFPSKEDMLLTPPNAAMPLAFGTAWHSRAELSNV